MQCTSCKYEHSSVVETKHNKLEDVIRRRRECLKCGNRWTTHEKLREGKPIDDRFPHRNPARGDRA